MCKQTLYVIYGLIIPFNHHLRLEITLAKSNADEPWTEVVSGDSNGIYDANGSDASMLSDMISDKTGVR